MRSLTVTLLGVITLLSFSAIVLVAQTVEDVYQHAFPGLGSPCAGSAVCTAVHLCQNDSSSSERVVDISSKDNNPCGHYLLKCCDPDKIIQEPGFSDAGNGGDSTTASSVSARPTVAERSTGCGLRYSKGIDFRITSASDNESEYGEFPWMVSILEAMEVMGIANQSVYLCGGSLIHHQVVLTAAHCLNKIQKSKLTVRAGEWDTQTTRERYPTQDRSVAEIVIHPEYYKAGALNDVALLFLDSPFQPKKIIQPVCLPPSDAKFDHQTCFATGWGKDRYGKAGTYQAILRKIDLPIVPNDQCQTALRTTELDEEFTLHKSFICAGGEEGKDTCKGDGGSPLVCPVSNRQDQYYQAGIVSWGMGCGDKGIPGVYANVAMFRKWIDQHMIQRNFGTSSYTAKEVTILG
ncbi:phenoloxidase-activating factor 2-like [Anopheles albimanus]|uniref:phenoloxidase-activating factor 2-like n=1 Tax=Anopheles albimanus TaxID=7167 RepID=UPI00164008EB|nr:phenoloxidase-activating factor 2-like [Anopheles albimanus]